MSASRFGFGLLLATGLTLDFGTGNFAAAQATYTTRPQSPATDKADDPDFYDVPEGNVKEMMAFIKRLQSKPINSAEESRTHREKADPAMKAALEKILQNATADEKKSPEYADALGFNLQQRSQGNVRASAEDQRKLLDEAKALLVSTETPSNGILSALQNLAMNLEFGGQHQAAADAYGELGPLLAQKDMPRTKEMAEKFVGAARRMTLLGKPVELAGTLMDGSAFDWAKYRGKVVLIDFWATWCGPCIAELPNVKKNYANYHDRGFDVVGVSVDRDRAALEAYLAKEGTPWATIHDGDWAVNKVAQYYGILGIPTVFLVDKEGKVVSLNARGNELTQQLERLLGPVEAAP